MAGTLARGIVAVGLMTLLGLVPAVLAQPIEPARETPSELSASASPLHARDLDAKFRLARHQLSLQAYSPVVGTIQDFLQATEGHPQFVLFEAQQHPATSEFWNSTAAAARWLLEQLPLDERHRFIARLEKVAQVDLQQAIDANDLDALRSLGAKYPLTMASREARLYLMSYARDVGDHRAGGIRDESEGAASSSRRTGDKMSPVREQGWHALGGLSVETIQALRESQTQLFEQSIPLVPRARPHVRSEVVVTRLMQRLVAIDAQSGRELWTDAGATGALDPTTQLGGNLSLKELVAKSLGRQSQLDSVLPSLTLTSDAVVSVDPVEPGLVMLPNALNRADVHRSNVLRARRLQTGELIWSFNGDCWTGRSTTEGQRPLVIPELGVDTREPSSAKALNGDIYFLGAPRVIDRALWGLAQVGSSILGYEVSLSDGRCLWSAKIGESSRSSGADADWKTLAGRVELLNDRVVFMTGSGLVAAFDLVTRTPLWARREQRHDIPPLWRTLGIETAGHRAWWNGWRETQAIECRPANPMADASSSGRRGRDQDVIRNTTPPSRNVEPCLVTVGPDQALVRALNLDGTIRWQLDVADGLALQAVDTDCVLIVDRHTARLVDALSGRVRWLVRIPTASGSGFVIGPNADFTDRIVVLPCHQELVALRLSDGQWERFPLPDNVTVNHLAETSDQRVIASGVDGLRSLPSWSQLRRARELDDERVRNSEQRLPRLIRAAESLTRGTALQVDRATLEIAWDALGSSLPDVQTIDDGDALRRVRSDRIVAGLLLDSMSVDAETRVWFQAKFETERARMMSSPDPFAIQRFAQRFGWLNAAQDIVVSKPAQIGMSHLQTQLLLQSQVTSADFKQSNAVLKLLAEHYRSRSYDDDVRATLHQALQLKRSRLRRDESSSSMAAASLMPFADDAQWQALEMQFGTRPKSVWPTTTPTATEQELAKNEIAFLTVPIEAAPGSLLARIDVGFHWHSANTVRFVGDGRSSEWSITLPKANSNLNFRRMPPLLQGWGLGHLLILRAGTELFAIAPLDEVGEPKARLLWHRDTRPDAQFEGQRLKPSRLGFQELEILFLDGFDRPLGAVGPVRAGYLCYQSQGKLICLEPSTGIKLWERFEVPHDARITGDEEHIFITSAASDRVQTLRVLDGREVAHWAVAKNTAAKQDASVDSTRTKTVVTESQRIGRDGIATYEFVTQLGAFYVQRQTDRLEARHMRTGEVLWYRKLPAETHPFAVDEHTLGVLEPITVRDSTRYRAVWLDVATGNERFQVDVEGPSKLDVLYCISDLDSYYLVLSGPRRAEATLMLGDPRWHRNPPINGPVVALDAHDGRVRWQSNWVDTNFMLDPPRSVPFLTLTTANWSKDIAMQRPPTALSLVDKRTGQTLIRTNDTSDSLHLIRPNSQQGWATVRTRTKELRVEFRMSTP